VSQHNLADKKILYPNSDKRFSKTVIYVTGKSDQFRFSWEKGLALGLALYLALGLVLSLALCLALGLALGLVLVLGLALGLGLV
jgi:hypothetical protein